jgi:hypothetical protein
MYHKLYIHDGQFHLWFTMCSKRSMWEDPPDFRMGHYGWERVASWPITVPFSESALDDILTEWLLYRRGRGVFAQFTTKEIEELASEHVREDARLDNAAWERERARIERERVSNFAAALTS